MNQVWVLKLFEREISATTSLLEKKKADKVLSYVETYLVGIIELSGLNSSWCEIKEAGLWHTEFLFKFQEPHPGLKKSIEFALNRALMETADEISTN